jgi:hypothetical protein
VLVAITSGTTLVLVIAALAAVTLVPPIGARRTARATAERELAPLLAPGERPVARAWASQREWTDTFREAFGLLVATDRRLLWVSAPPEPLFRPLEAGPPELRVQAVPYDATFTLEPRTYLLGSWRGLTLRTPLGEQRFLVADADFDAATAVARAAASARRATTDALALEQAAQQAPAPEVVTYGTHVVRAGETLTALARRYRTTPAILQQLNALPTGAIRSGQRLRVPMPADGDSLPLPP